MLPADAGCIVHNVDTIYSIYMAVIEGKPLTKRIVTVTGDGVKNPGNFYVWLGMNYRQLLMLPVVLTVSLRSLFLVAL